jgi:prophage antirepressor-like protein
MVPSPSTPLVFTFPETAQHVRSVMIDGEPWWLAKDVCSVLDIKNSRDAVARLDSDGVGQTDVIDSMGRKQSARIVNEPGLYELIIRSDRPQAKAFRRWITHEVIPSIRETGRYEAPGAPTAEVQLNDLDSIAQIHQALGLALDVARSERERADKAEAFQSAIEAGDGLTLRSFHKKYFSALTERTFMDHLYACGYLINQRGKGSQRDNGSYRDGSQHRHPAAKGKPFFYLHGHGEIGGARRENTRVRPGEPELELKARLIKDGLTANNNDTGQPRAIEATSAPQLELEAGR